MFAKMKTGTKVLSGFGIAVVVAVATGLVGYRGITNLHGHVEKIGGNRLPSVRAACEMGNGHLQVNYALRGLNNRRTTGKTRLEQYDLVERGLKHLDQARKMYEGLQQDTTSATLWREYTPLCENWKKEVQKMVDMSREKDFLISGGAAANDSKVADLDDRVNQQGMVVRQAMLASDAKLDEITTYNVEQCDAAMKRAGSDASSALILTVAFIMGGVIAMLGFGVFLSKNISKTLRTITNEATRLAAAAMEGNLQTRGNSELVTQEFRPIIEGVNAMMNTLVGIIDSIPAPAMIIGRDFDVRYVNDMAAKVIGSSKQQIMGTKCHEHFRTPHCQTANCACGKAMQQGQLVSAETTASPGGHELEISYVGSPIKDGRGQVVGALEFVTDLTAVKKAGKVAAKVAEFQAAEAAKLTENLGKLAEGDLNCTIQTGAYDEDTADAHKTFKQIADALNSCIEALTAITQKGEIGQALNRMANKDFSRPIKTEYPGAYGELRDNVNLVVESIRAAIEQITESANQFAEGSRTIAESAQTLAQGAQTQSASVEQMTASTEELARSVSAVKENASASATVAAKSNELADEGGKAVQKSIESMEQIRSSSQQISEIIQVISEIASQTNLLALNAAIEAARAGEHG